MFAVVKPEGPKFRAVVSVAHGRFTDIFPNEDAATKWAEDVLVAFGTRAERTRKVERGYCHAHDLFHCWFAH